MDGTNIRRKKSGLLAGPAAAEPRTSPLLPGPGAGALPALGRGAGRWGNCVLGQHAPRRERGAKRYSPCGQFASGVPTRRALTSGMVLSPGGWLCTRMERGPQTHGETRGWGLSCINF